MDTYTATTQALGITIAAKIPGILWSAPGQGKTSVLDSIAEQNDCDLTTVLASIREPSDFAGLPNVVGSRTELIAPGWAQDIANEDSREQILFFDEISTAPPSVQAALLRVCLDKVVGDLELGDNVAVVAAANPPEIAADGWDLAPPMANRFVHLDWDLPASVVAQGFADEWPVVSIPQIDEEAAAVEVAKAKSLVGAFLKSRPDVATVMPKDSSESGRAFPTPRSWENAAVLYGYVQATNTDPIVGRMLINGTVGVGAASEFLTFVSDMDLPDPESLLADPTGWDIPNRGDKVYAVGTSVIAVLKNENNKKRWDAAGVVFKRVIEAGHADVAVPFLRSWLQNKPTANATPDKDVMAAILPAMKDSGAFSNLNT